MLISLFKKRPRLQLFMYLFFRYFFLSGLQSSCVKKKSLAFKYYCYNAWSRRRFRRALRFDKRRKTALARKLWRVKKLNYFFRKYKLHRKIRRTKLKSYLYLIYKRRYYKFGFFSANYRVHFLRSFLNLNFAVRFSVKFLRNCKFFAYCLRLKRRRLRNVTLLNYLLYYLYFQFFIVLFSMNWVGHLSANFLKKFRLISVLRYLYPRMFFYCKFYLRFLLRYKRKRVRFKRLYYFFYSTRLVVKVQKNIYKNLWKILLLFKAYLSKFFYLFKLGLVNSLYSLGSVKSYLRLGYVFINGCRQKSYRKQLLYGDSIFITCGRHFLLKKYLTHSWFRKMRYNYGRAFFTSFLIPWCAMVLNNLSTRNHSKRAFFFKQISKKLFEIFFVLYRGF